MAQYSPGWIMMDMRSLSGDIAYHIKITKDKYGEVELYLYLLNEFFEQHSQQLETYNSKSDKCSFYMAKKVQTLLNKLTKLDEEYYIDFEKNMAALLAYVHSMCTAPYANQLKITRDWP
jgi:prenyltransferase beta subunit